MIAITVVASIFLGILLCLVTLLQLLHMESVRLRARELPALTFFKETLQAKVGLSIERGALAFSLIKHTLILLMVMVFLLPVLYSEPFWEAALQASIFAWITMLVATYMAPHLLYRKTSGRWLLPLMPVLRAMVLVVTPLVYVLGFFESLVELAQPGETNNEPPTPAEHIDALISAGEEEGIIEEDDRRLIQSVVAFGDKTVREVMTPRPNIVAIAVTQSLDDLRQLVVHEQYSRVPVYQGGIDDIIGFVHVRDLFEADAQDRHLIGIRDLLRPIRFVPETKPVNDLLREMQQESLQMVVVIDEYGNTAGIATMEDLVEEILGEIHDEHEPERDVKQEGEDTWVVAGSLDLDRLNDLLGFRPQEETESTTVGGLITEWLGHVPSVGEAVEREGIRIQVLAGNELRVEQVRVSRAARTHV
ncbi:MAG TPA: hemolysin family protein [Bryobacteraceae bacterium]|nr:hemolysin family protein [Bryobacteraceae bacterium]